MRSAQNIRNTDVANDTFTKGMPRQNSDDKPHDTKYPKADNTIAADWSVRRYRLGAQGLVWIEFRFPIEGGERGRIVVANSQLRHASKLLDDFANYSPIYPTTVGTTDDQRVQFLRNLVAACNRPLELIPDRTGFFDPCTFVTRSEILRSDGSRGPRCRLFDIAVPEPSKGGIFDRLSGSAKARAKRSVALIAKLERGYSNHPGHTIPAWISVLLTRDWSKRIVALADEFVSLVVPDGNGWERRFARKFGVVYAAMTLAVETGVLPWPEDLPKKVTRKCYRKARAAAAALPPWGRFG